jgi:hypothetical protein
VRKQPVARMKVVRWVVGLVSVMGMLAPARAQAQLPAFGMVGLAAGQRAVLNLVDVGTPDASHPGCRVTASFVDSMGRVLNDAKGVPVRRTVTLRPQVATSIQLLARDILAPGQQRRSIRPVVAPARNSSASGCSCFVPTLEILASNGVTTLTDSGHAPKLSPNPPPPPPICEALVIPGQ